MDRTADRDLKARALKVIPNGMYGHEAVHALPATFPQFFERAEGAYIRDADGNRYLDFMCAYGPSLLGYRDQRVDAAAAAQAAKGDTMTGPSPVMVDLAEALVSMVTHADWAMFCKNGTDATSMAMVAARAQTGKRIVLLAKGAYRGAAPWCTPNPVGVVAEDRAMLRYYEYNNAESLEAAVQMPAKTWPLFSPRRSSTMPFRPGAARSGLCAPGTGAVRRNRGDAGCR
jgi:glutamate-1-semialdehyde 2,1-aminomutase